MTTAQVDRPKFTRGTTSAPAAAFQFAASAVKFSAGDDESQSKSKPFEMLVRSGGPVPHWYFGMIVHDFAGMRTKPVVAVDWNHDPDEIIGKAGEFDTTSGDLIARGSIESIEVGDQADKIIKLSAVGVPYEGSIYFDPYELVLENVPEGFVAEVNGQTVEGPIVIAREWMLRRIAITPSGVDSASEVRFSAASSATSFSLNVKDCPTMSKSPENTTDAKPADTTPKPTEFAANPATPTGTDARTQFAAELKRFTDKFGAADGATYFSAQMSYEQALETHLAKVTEANKATEAAKLSAEQRLAAVNLGEKTALHTTEREGSANGEGAKTSFSTNFQAATKKAQQKAHAGA